MKKCELCQFEYNDGDANFHHLIPKSLHKNKYIVKHFKDIDLNKYGLTLCKSCHNKIHSCINEKELALKYNSLELLKTHKDIQIWLIWKQKHPNFINTYNRKTK